MLLASSRPGDLVLDPFFGTGTTGAVAGGSAGALSASSATRLCGVGARAHRRRSAPAEGDLVRLESKREAPRVPFGSLVERGLLQPGEVLFDATPPLDRAGARRRQPDRRPSTAARSTRSAPQLQGAPACNGWAFWHVERRGQPVSIDWFRQQLRSEMAPPAGTLARFE